MSEREQVKRPEGAGGGEVSRVETRQLGVVLERRAGKTRWVREVWAAVDVLPGAPDVAAGTPLIETPELTRWYAGAYPVSLYAGETANYKFNLGAREPKAYVILRRAAVGAEAGAGSAEKPGGGVSVLQVTLDPLEAHAHADTGDDQVEAVPLAAPLRAWLSDFVRRFHVERRVWKRKRDKADPEALATRSRIERRRVPKEEG